MRPQDAQRIGEQLSAYLDGELSQEERDAVEALLASDADARALLAELRDASGAVRALPRDRAPASILEQINARLERSELLGPAERKVTLARHKRRPIRSTLAMAASLLFVVSGGLWVYFRVAESQDLPSGKLVTRDQSPSPFPANDMPMLQDDLRRLAGRTSVTESAPIQSDEEVDQLSALGYAGFRGQPESDLEAQSGMRDQVAFAESSARGEAAIDTARSAETVVGVPIRGFDGSVGEERAAAGRFEFESATLEQKLAAGDGLDAVAMHRFDAEPLQIQLVVDRGHRSHVESTLVSVLAGSGAIPLDSLGMKESTAPTSQAFYEYGRPGDNYAPGAAPQRQILARVSPRAIERILETAAAQDDSVQDVRFGVGQMSAEGVDESMRIARLVIPVDAADAGAVALGEPEGRGAFGGGGRFDQEDFKGIARAEGTTADDKSEITGPPADPAELLAWLFDAQRVPAAAPAESGGESNAVAQTPATERYDRDAVAKTRAESDDRASDAVAGRRARQVGADETPATSQPADQAAEPLSMGTAVAMKNEQEAQATQPADADGDEVPDARDWPLYTIVIQIIEKVAESPAPQSQPARE